MKMMQDINEEMLLAPGSADPKSDMPVSKHRSFSAEKIVIFSPKATTVSGYV
jgi:hypothetical protein